MKESVEYIVKALVDHPEHVSVHQEDKGSSVLLELSVHSEDMGKVIGKNGRVAKAIRNVANAAGVIQNKNVRLDIVE
jgi:predicted RNA-binding protein YlqC (UPF0109 family)